MRRLLLPFLLYGLIAGAVQGAAVTPELNIPRIDGATADRLLNAGKFNPDLWQCAATVNRFDSPTRGICPVGTVFYLCHDGNNLLVAVQSTATPADRAFRRGAKDNLTLDEAVQVVLGIGGRIHVKLVMGGYDGAFSEQEPVAHFYEYTCNQAGSWNRRYNETPLADPMFESMTSVDDSGSWTTVFKIPFASAGIHDPIGKNFYFNLFRFHDSERYGWHLPAFGGYNKLPFGLVRFLDFSENDRRTLAGPPPELPESRKAVAAVSKTTPRLEYYAIDRNVVAEIPAASEEEVAVLEIDGNRVNIRSNPYAPARGEISVATYLVGTSLDATLTLSNGKKLEKKITVPALPDWAGTTAGIEYVTEKVPLPWTAPIYQDGAVELAHATLQFGNSPLPKSIVGKHGEILGAPIRVTARAAGRDLPVATVSGTEVNPTNVIMHAEEEPGIQVKTMVDFDGFMIVRLRFAGGDARTLDNLTLTVPLRKGLLEFVNNGNTQQLVNTGGFSYTANHNGALWCGNEFGGIFFETDKKCFFSAPDGRQIEINGDELKIRLVGEAGEVANPDQVFQFYLQPTPMRAEQPPFRPLTVWFESWSDWQAYPDMAKAPEMKKRSNEAHEKNKDFYIYFGHCMAEDAPDYAKYPTDLQASPRVAAYTRGYDPGKGVPCSIVCFRGAAGELLLDRIEKLADETGLDGVYLDGPTLGFPCENINHQCSDRIPAEWDSPYTESRVPGIRVFIKRLRGIFDKRGHHTPLYSHTGGAFELATIGLCDYYVDGEHLSRYRPGYLLEPEKFRILYTGVPFGFRGVFLTMFYVDSILTSRIGQLWTFPHNAINSASVDISDHWFFGVVRRDPEAKFYGYWEPQPHIVNQKENTLCTSYFKGANEAMLVSSNIVYDGEQTAQLDLSGMFPGQAITVRSLNSDGDFTFTDNILSFPVRERDYRIFHIAPSEIPVEQFDLPDVKRKEITHEPVSLDSPITESNPEDWTISGGSSSKPGAFDLPLTFKAGDNDAIVEFSRRLPEEFKVRMIFAHTGKFKIVVDSTEITFDYHSAKGWFIDRLDKYDNYGLSETTVKYWGRSYSAAGRPVELGIVFYDGRISVIYDGVRILDRGLPEEKHSGSHSLKFIVGKDESIGFAVKEISGSVTAADPPKRNHPVRPADLPVPAHETNSSPVTAEPLK